MEHTTRKIIKDAYERFANSHLYTLRDCYNSFSESKENAFNYCRNLYEKYNGFSGKIISYNQNVFTYGFTGVIDGRNAFFYITRDYDRYIFIDEI